MELWLQCFAEGHSLGSDHVHQRPALLAGEHGAIQASRKLCLAHGQARAGSAQRLVRGGGHHVRVRHRRGVYLARDQTCEVRHVDHQVGPDRVSNGTHALKVPDTRVRRTTADDHLRVLALGQRFQLVVVDGLGVAADLVSGNAVQLAGKIELMAVRQVTAMCQVEAQDGVARLDQRHVRGGVRLRAGVRLHVDVVGSEQLLGTIAGHVLDHVGNLAPTVVTLAGIAFGVLVRKHRSHRLEHGA